MLGLCIWVFFCQRYICAIMGWAFSYVKLGDLQFTGNIIECIGDICVIIDSVSFCMASQWHKALNDTVPAAQEQHHYMQTAAFWSQSSLSWDLEQRWAGVGVTPPATPTANTSHLTARRGCAFAASFMQICTCSHLSKNKHAHRH